MSTVEIRPRALVTKDPASSQFYEFSWDRLAAGAIITESRFSIRAVNAAAASLVQPVTLDYVDPLLTVTFPDAHGIATGEYVTLADLLPDDFNGTWAAIVTSATILQVGMTGYPQLTTSSGIAGKGIDEATILADAPAHNSRFTRFRYTGGVLGAIVEIANRIVTNESPPQVKERSFRILIENL